LYMSSMRQFSRSGDECRNGAEQMDTKASNMWRAS